MCCGVDGPSDYTDIPESCGSYDQVCLFIFNYILFALFASGLRRMHSFCRPILPELSVICQVLVAVYCNK